MHFLDIIFQQDIAPVHKSKIIGNFVEKNEWKALEWAAYSPDLNPIENLWAIVKQQFKKQAVFRENLEEKVYGIRNEIDPDVVRNLYENYTKRLLDVKEAKGVMTRYQRTKFELRMLHVLMFLLLFKKSLGVRSFLVP